MAQPQAKEKPGKFVDPFITAKGEQRASVRLKTLETLWFNTGSLCNITCVNCFMESSPKNDRLVYLTTDEVKTYLDEIERDELPVRELGFTGGEPFMNRDMIPILELGLSRGFDVLVLTNAMKPMHLKQDKLLALKNAYPDKLSIRVSMDHYDPANHEKMRGPKSWQPMMDGFKWLSDNQFKLAVAGRTCWNETDADARRGYKALFEQEGITLDCDDPWQLVLFPEMDETADVPEITTDCWGILNVSPEAMMCASSRMVVKRRGANAPTVLPCTLLPYDQSFDMGQTLAEGSEPVQLNHPHCARFCVLGGGSCSG
ncbi:radical SAM protein [Coralliovum pocilloporae]|uniref:radical SAM protein n=1 Tax=Coralliovum pocilloporae TaxID=3066369 RepID=UPI003307A7E6